MATPASFLFEMLDRADAQLVAGWYHTVSVSTDRVRAGLRHSGLSFVDPVLEHTPSMMELDLTAEKVIAQAALGASALSGAAGLVGAISMPPEFVASMVSILRMGQRLCIVYGFDPRRDRGQMALCRALAAAYDVDLPSVGPVGMRVSDLTRLSGPPADLQSIGASLARAILVRSAWWVAGRVTRYVPVVSATSTALAARQRTEQAARRMQGVLKRLTEVPGPYAGLPEDAIEIRGA